ncbi:YcxB family protein [Brachyspira pilosicoli]|uniref:YcxB family protein n=1 Tax=Brachyspira pilosicoli TaxID=52584 RepID=UPI003005ABD4
MKREYRYNIEHNDFIDFQLHYLKTNPELQTSLKKNLIIIIIVYVILLAGMFVYFKSSLFMLLVVAVLITFVSVLQIISYKKRMQKNIVKKVLSYIKTGKLDDIFGEKILTVYDEKIVFNETKGIKNFNKSDIKKIEQSKLCVFIYTDDMSAIIVPKKYLSKEDIDFLLSYKKS